MRSCGFKSKTFSVELVGGNSSYEGNVFALNPDTNVFGPVCDDSWNIEGVSSILKSRGGGQVVRVLAFYSDNSSSNPAEAYSFFCEILCLKRTKINKNKAGIGPF